MGLSIHNAFLRFLGADYFILVNDTFDAQFIPQYCLSQNLQGSARIVNLAVL